VALVDRVHHLGDARSVHESHGVARFVQEHRLLAVRPGAEAGTLAVVAKAAW
jgi:hypothetical protein